MEENRFEVKISAIKEAFGVSSKTLADYLGLSTRTFSDYVTAKTEPKYTLLVQLLSLYPNLSAEWLMRGRGPMIVEPGPTESLIDTTYYSRLAEIRQKRIEELEEQVARLQVS